MVMMAQRKAAILALCSAVAVLAGSLVVGGIPIRADVAPPAWESAAADALRHHAVRQQVPPDGNPIRPTEADLSRGLRLYQQNCAGCHGMGTGGNNDFGQAFYPPVPQLGRVTLCYSDRELAWVIAHGIRLTGMPAYSNMMAPDDIWRVATFLAHKDTLPQAIDRKWRSCSP